jgi:hypothetical protein
VVQRDVQAILKDTNSLAILENLSAGKYSQQVGHQLARSGCVEKLLEILFDESTSKVARKWQKLVADITKHSLDLRDAFGTKTISLVVEKGQVNSKTCEFLCYFAHVSFLTSLK